MREKGIIITLVLVFGTIFLMLLASLLGFILLQQRQSLQKVAWNEALHLAEAGINYSRWHINHAEDDFNFGGVKSYEDIGQFQLEISPPSGCSSGVKIVSSAWTNTFPSVKRKIQVKDAKPALAKYAFLTNSNVWFGPDEELKGPFHSNGGIRMDGSQNSLATSAKATYICGAEHGCSPPQEKPGIWGEGEGGEEGLWQFPVPAIDFDKILQDLAILKAEAQSSGVYISQPVDHGYHVRFKVNPDGTGAIDVFRVKTVKQKVYGWDGEKWVYESNDIGSEELFASYPLPQNCAPIFIENKVWVDGVVKGKAVVVAAVLPEQPNKMKSIIIPGNIDYADANSVLGLIAQKDILIPLRISDDPLKIQAALLAKEGGVMRYFYPLWDTPPYQTYSVQNSIEIYGSIISKKEWTFTWVDEEENIISGYRETKISIDPRLVYQPPPHFPAIREATLIGWEEVE